MSTTSRAKQTPRNKVYTRRSGHQGPRFYGVTFQGTLLPSAVDYYIDPKGCVRVCLARPLFDNPRKHTTKKSSANRKERRLSLQPTLERNE